MLVELWYYLLSLCDMSGFLTLSLAIDFKSNSPEIVQKSGIITVETVREKNKQKVEKEIAALIGKARNNIQISITKVKAAINSWGMTARRSEKNRKKEVTSIER